MQTDDYVYLSSDGSRENLKQLATSPTLAFDVESSGPHVGTDVPFGFSLACEPIGAYYSLPGHPFFRHLLADERKLKIAHNAVYDRSMTKKIGITIDNLCCTMVAAHLLEEEFLALKGLVLGYLGEDITAFSELNKRLEDMTLEELCGYSGPHSIAALKLWYKLEERMKRLRLLDVFWSVEMPLVPVLSDMELNGVTVDLGVLKELGGYFDGKTFLLNRELDHISGTSGVNFNSPKQVAKLFYKELGLPRPQRKTRTGEDSVDKRFLTTIKDKHPVIPLYLAFKEYKTLKNSYVDSLGAKIQSDGRVYGFFNQTRTRTGRLSSSEPNLQKIPVRTVEGRQIRKAFVAPEGKVLLKADYDLLELKMMAICSKDEALLGAFRAGRDVHEETAIKVYQDKGRRADGKTLDFKLIYLGGDEKEKAMFFGAYPGVKIWTDETIKLARDMLYTRTLNGRIRTIPEYEAWRAYATPQKVLEHGDREVISTIVQGTSAEVVKIGMRKVWEKTKDTEVKMLMQVHDELVFEVPVGIVHDVAKVVREAMTYSEYEIPLTVSIKVGQNWEDMHELKED